MRPEPFEIPAEPGSLAESERLERARAGERGAQEELLRAHYPRVHATAFRLLGNPEDAEDLAQECFVRALRSLTFYRGEGSFAGWLRRILVHLVQDRFRSRERSETSGLPEGLCGRGEPYGEAEARELGRILAESLASLSPPLGIAFVLRAREGLEYAEIAAATGVTPETARTRVMKARRILLRLVAPHLAERDAKPIERRGG